MQEEEGAGIPEAEPVGVFRRAKRRLRPPIERLLAPLGCVVAAKTSRPAVAITFDDGPHPRWTPPILEVMTQSEATATFFFLCANAEKHPALARDVRDAGHEVGLHGIDHTSLKTLSARDILRRTREGRDRLEQLLGQPVRLFRPPYGDQRFLGYSMVRTTGLDVVMWNSVGDDWLEQPAERAATLIVPTVTAGSVILLHDGWEPPMGKRTAAPTFDRGLMVEVLLKGLSERHLAATSVGDLMSSGSPIRSVASLF
jgi:peptidoglycan/xylan/chitin deacetylase (PgdA/CDA1 family)